MAEEHLKKDKKIDTKELIYHANCTTGHTSMYMKIYNVGESQRNRERLRESLLGHHHPATMKLLGKDHKPKNKEGLMKTRPVVAGNTSHTVGLGEILTDVLKPIMFQRRKDKGRNINIVSSDDMISRINNINDKLENDEEFVKDLEQRVDTGEPLITNLGGDVVALYPSLEKGECSETVFTITIESSLDIRGADYSEGLVYIAMNRDKLTKE